MIALLALALVTLAVGAVMLAAVHAHRSIDPTLAALRGLRADLAPALVRVRTDQERARSAAARRPGPPAPPG